MPTVAVGTFPPKRGHLDPIPGTAHLQDGEAPPHLAGGLEERTHLLRARRPEVRRTAGYVQDGRRFLAEIAPVLEDEGIDPAELVRSR